MYWMLSESTEIRRIVRERRGGLASSFLTFRINPLCCLFAFAKETFGITRELCARIVPRVRKRAPSATFAPGPFFALGVY